MDAVKFSQLFHSEEACEKYLYKMKFPEGFHCPKCQHNEYYYHKPRKLYQCKACKHQTSLTAGTIFHKTRTPLQKWFHAIYLEASDKRGVAALALTKKLKISYWVAWTMLSKIREAMGKRDAKYLLAGLVELDDGFVGAPDKGGKRGRGTGKQQVVAEAATNGEAVYYAKMKAVDNFTQETVEELAKETIAPGATVKTDALAVNKAVAKSGYDHIEVTVKGKDPAEELKWVHILLSNVKAFLQGTFHGIGKKHIQRYLDAFCYRFNRRFWEEQLFDRLLMSCLLCPPVTFAELTQ